MRLIYLLFCLCLISCNPYKQFTTSNLLCNHNPSFFKINESDVFFDVKAYDKNTILINNDSLKKKIRIIKPANTKEFRYSISIEDKRNNFTKYMGYYLSGKIRYCRFLSSEFIINVEKETYFDEQGNITKMIDHEKGYKICWAEAIAIMKKRYRSLIRKYEIHSFHLRRSDLNEFPDKKPKWTILMEGNESYEESWHKHGRKHYEIDGITGKFIRSYVIEKISH